MRWTGIEPPTSLSNTWAHNQQTTNMFLSRLCFGPFYTIHRIVGLGPWWARPSFFFAETFLGWLCAHSVCSWAAAQLAQPKHFFIPFLFILFPVFFITFDFELGIESNQFWNICKNVLCLKRLLGTIFIWNKLMFNPKRIYLVVSSWIGKNLSFLREVDRNCLTRNHLVNFKYYVV